MLADPDDFYMKDSMEKRINILKKNEDYAIVTSDAYYYRFNDLNNPIKKHPREWKIVLTRSSLNIC